MRRISSSFLLCIALTACSSLDQLQPPNANITAIRPLPGHGLLPDFAIDIHLTNPNDRELSLRGASYSFSLEGQQLVTGVASKLPPLPAYGEADITLTAVPDIFNAISFVNKIMQDPQINALHYRLEARLDVAAALPDIVIDKEGIIGKP